jgi:hypothetical protein
VPFYPYELVQYMTTYAINRFRLADLSNWWTTSNDIRRAHLKCVRFCYS